MLAASDAAPQHVPFTPRPFPLFLELARREAAADPALLARILAGVRRYESAPRPALLRPQTDALGPMRAWFSGDTGPWVVLVPSLINPAWIMDLDAERSLLRWLGTQGFRVALLDWEGSSIATPAADRDLAAHVTDLLLPSVQALAEPAHIVGYCLGGILAAAAAERTAARSLTLLATPWHFDRYPAASGNMLGEFWRAHAPAVTALGALPMELLQSAFWGLDPARTVRKFAAIADAGDDDPALSAFVRLEDWANGGAALPAPAGRDLFEQLFAANALATGGWLVGGSAVGIGPLPCPAHQFTANADRIAPAASACERISATACPSGHVGMMVGRGALDGCWHPLARWLRAH